MRIALCLYGQPRTYEFCAQSIREQLIDPNNADVFICSDSKEAELTDLYNPKEIKILSQPEIQAGVAERAKRMPDKVPNPGVYKKYPIFPKIDLSFMYIVTKCGELVDFSKYDVIIGTRLDIKFLHVEPIESCEPNTLYIPRVDASGGIADKDGIHWNMGYSTHLWWGSSYVGENILKCFYWTEQIYNETKVWTGEGMTKRYCENMKFNAKHTDVTCMLIRGTSQNPCSALPPWPRLSSTNHPEYLPSEWIPTKEEKNLPW